MTRKDNSKLRELIHEYGIKNMNDVHEFVKMLTAETIQAALDAELDSELGYSKYDYKNKQTDNSRNDYSSKTVQGNMGEMQIQVPRDRNSEFEPQLVKKHQTDVSAIEDKVIFNRQLRKVTKTKSAFVSDDALIKILYLTTMNIVEKWTMPIREWGTILDHLMIYFGERVKISL